MGIEYSTPLVALTSAWFFDKCEIVQISIHQNQSVVNAFLPIMFVAKVNIHNYATCLYHHLHRSSVNDFDEAKLRN